jgi:hypothetical protein
MTTGLKALGLFGNINTAFGERLNLTIRQEVAFLVHRIREQHGSHRNPNYTCNGGGDTTISPAITSPLGFSSLNPFSAKETRPHAATAAAPPPWQPDSLHIAGQC